MRQAFNIVSAKESLNVSSVATPSNDFDVKGMYSAMDTQRIERALSWRQVAVELWEQSSLLNELRDDHPISASTLTGIAKRGDCTCQHALFILRWLGRTPESFCGRGTVSTGEVALPVVGQDRRLRWNLAAVYRALERRRRDEGLTWLALAKKLRCSPHQLTGIRTARYAIGMILMMRIVEWLEQPAATFVYAARW